MAAGGEPVFGWQLVLWAPEPFRVPGTWLSIEYPGTRVAELMRRTLWTGMVLCKRATGNTRNPAFGFNMVLRLVPDSETHKRAEFPPLRSHHRLAMSAKIIALSAV
eukprot:3610286-Rhodomonas_salina.1